jgi:serine/threonine protein phosphatase PrpC
MVEEITSIYEIHRWARYAIWAILFIMALFFSWLFGGIPPSAWRELAGTIPLLRGAWAAHHGFGAVFALLRLALVSLLELLCWCLLLGASLGLLWHHWWWRQRERAMAQMLSAQGTVPMLPVMPPRKKSRPVRKVISFLLAGPMESAIGNNHTRNKPVDGRCDKDDPTASTASVPLLRLPQQDRPVPEALRVSTKREAERSRPSRTTTSPCSTTMTTLQKSLPALSLEVGVGWHVGKARRSSPNEDSLIVLQGLYTSNDRLVPFGLLLVADGMGGHAYGREASHIAIQAVTQAVVQDIFSSNSAEETDDKRFIDMLTRGIEQANQAICGFSEEVGKGKDTAMGTTLTAALVCRSQAYVVNVGDSRTYLYRPGEGLLQVTRDHSLVARLVETGQIEPDDVYTHPNRNQVYRSVGNGEGVDVDWFIAEVRFGDRLLLCSDGLWEMVRDPVIEKIMSSEHTMTNVSERLVRAALSGGGRDNISVIVAEVM